jgi:tellurite methyltransferase
MSPSTFVTEWMAARRAETGAVSSRRVRLLDVAMGRGRHALLLARAGFDVFGVDINVDAVAEATRQATREGLRIRAWCADLTRHPLPSARFDVVLVTRYLQRDLLRAIGETVRPGGVVIYETFTTRQLQFGVGPRSPDHLLQPGELRRAFEAFEMLFYEEVDAPEAVARLIARRPQTPQSY